MEVFHIANLIWFLLFFIPGFISLKVYDLLIANEPRDFSKALYEAIAYSAINFGLLSWLIWPAYKYELYQNYPWIFGFICFLVLFVFPIVWPVLYTKLLEHPWLSKHTVDLNRRSWDYLFSKGEDYWIIVNLKDGRKIGGIFSTNSHASSYPLPEQVYIEQLWKLDENGHFKGPVERSKGVLILDKEISSIEFFET